jgi:hypothetical protein
MRSEERVRDWSGTAVPRDDRSLARFSGPTRLAPLNYYLICDHQDYVARWENDSRGWMLHRGDGYVRVHHVPDEVPWFGEFVLIEIGIARDSGGTRLTHVQAFRLQQEFALLQLVKSDAAILGTITGPAVLNEAQKELVREFVKSRFLRPVWGPIDELLESA